MLHWFRLTRPSFLEGIARTLDIGGTLNVYPDFADEDEDVLALYADMCAISEDFEVALGVVAAQYGVIIEQEQ